MYDFVSGSRPSKINQALDGAPKSVGKKSSNRNRSKKRKDEIESTVNLLVKKDRSTPNYNFQAFCDFPAACQVTHPTCAAAVQTDQITNGYFSQQPSAWQLPLNIPLHFNITQ